MTNYCDQKAAIGCYIIGLGDSLVWGLYLYGKGVSRLPYFGSFMTQ